MNKDSFTRYSMRENMLKKVLIRVDYDGVTDINNWILQLKEDDALSSCFKSYHMALQNKTSFDLSKMEEFADSNSIPLSKIKSEPLHKFFDSDFQNREDIIEMEVSNLFLVFTISCNNYKNLDPYIEYLSVYFDRFLDFDKYINLKRVGIRKVGGRVFDSLEEVGETFEEELYGLNIKSIPKKKYDLEYVDRFFDEDRRVKVNFSRRCRAVDYEGKTKYQALLDLDGYVDSSIILHSKFVNPGYFKQLVVSINDYLFELYKISVTEQYLNNHAKIKC